MITPMQDMMAEKYVLRFDELNSEDVDKVGGKNASLGEMIQASKKEKIRVPYGFATTAAAYREFIKANRLTRWARRSGISL
jgi:pyruvate, water dikinase